MTREEFIASWGGAIELRPSSIERTADGVVIGGRRRLALPCACGDESCKGWAMVSEDDAADHIALYAPSLDRDVLLMAAGRRTVTAPSEEIIAAQERLIALGLLEQVGWWCDPTELGYDLARQIADQDNEPASDNGERG